MGTQAQTTTDIAVRDLQHGWCRIDNLVLEHYAGRRGKDGQPVGAYGIAVYAILARYADQAQRSCVSLGHLQHCLCLSRNSVIRALRRLEDVGLIQRIPRYRLDSVEREVTMYVLLAPERTDATRSIGAEQPAGSMV